MRAHLVTCLIFILLLAVPATSESKSFQSGRRCSDSNNDTVRLLVPAFEGPDALGLNVSTILLLEIFNTLDMSQSSDMKRRSFGHGETVWSPLPLRDLSHTGAADMAAHEDTACPKQLVLWGRALLYADGVVVQSYLTLPLIDDPRIPRNEVWTLRIKFKTDPIDLSLDIPSRRYAFEPIILDADVVRRYSDPASLKIYKDQSLKQQIGTTGPEILASRRGAGGTWLSKPAAGWLPLPQLSQNTSEVVGFTGALIRVFRGDWLGAQDLLKTVLSNSTTPNAIKTDAFIYMGMTEEKLRRSGVEYFERALQTNSLSEKAIAGLVMSNLSSYTRSSTASPDSARANSSSQAILLRTKDLLDKNKLLFEPDDPWFRGAIRACDRLIAGESVEPPTAATE